MKGKTTMNLCVAETVDLLERAIREHVLKNGDFSLTEVVWDEREDVFRITLEPKPEAKA